MKTTFKYKLGSTVGFREEWHTIIQLRPVFNRPYYRLSNGRVVSESFLYA